MNSDIEEQYQDIDEKTLIIQQVALLQSIDQKLSILLDGEANATARDTGDSEQEIVTCTNCKSEIPKTKRESHARECFKWNPEVGMDALDSRFE